jgi:hypothetical protein
MYLLQFYKLFYHYSYNTINIGQQILKAYIYKITFQNISLTNTTNFSSEKFAICLILKDKNTIFWNQILLCLKPKKNLSLSSLLEYSLLMQ